MALGVAPQPLEELGVGSSPVKRVSRRTIGGLSLRMRLYRHARADSRSLRPSWCRCRHRHPVLLTLVPALAVDGYALRRCSG
jgi:hypothetical protein